MEGYFSTAYRHFSKAPEYGDVYAGDTFYNSSFGYLGIGKPDVLGKAEIISRRGASLYFLKEKETFGEIGFVCGLDRTATVIAREDSLVLSVNHNLLENISNTDPEIKNVLLQNMVQSLGEKLVQANQRIEELVLNLKTSKTSTTKKLDSGNPQRLIADN